MKKLIKIISHPYIKIPFGLIALCLFIYFKLIEPLNK